MSAPGDDEAVTGLALAAARGNQRALEASSSGSPLPTPRRCAAARSARSDPVWPAPAMRCWPALNVTTAPAGRWRSPARRLRRAQPVDTHRLSLATQSAASSTVPTTVAPAGSCGRATITTGIYSAAAASSFARVMSPPLFLVTSA
jgi:hypothetical protein